MIFSRKLNNSVEPVWSWRRTMDTLVIRSTYRGFVSTIFWGIVWIVLLFLFSNWSGSYIDVYDKYDMRVPLSHVGVWGPRVIIVGILVNLLYTLIYGPLLVNTFTQNEKKHWFKLSEVTFSFPFSAGITSPADFAAPVVVGTMFTAALLPLLGSL